MKKVAEFIGIVNKFNQPPEVSYVSLKDLSNGKSVDTTAESEKLLEKGIGEGDEFSVVVEEGPEGAKATLTKLDPKPISQQTLDKINEQCQGLDI